MSRPNRTDAIQYAGDYILADCKIVTQSGLELDLKEQVASVNIYEDVFSNAISGDISILDTNNLLSVGPIVGQEKLLLKLATPSSSGTYNRKNSIDFTRSPLHVYKVSAKTRVNENTEAFTLSFTTPEMVRNQKVRVSRSFTGEPSEIVKQLVREESSLFCKKEFFFEKTVNNYTFVIPNMRPFDAINMIARRSLSSTYNFAPTYVFYETIKGFYFRSIDSMLDRKNPRMIYRETTPNADRFDIQGHMQNILKYDVVTSYDTLSNSRSGMYSSRMTLANLFTHEVQQIDYNYLDDFQYDTHVDSNRASQRPYPLVSNSRDDYGLRISDYPDSVLHTTSYETDEGNMLSKAYQTGVEHNNVNNWLLRRKSRFQQFKNGVVLRVDVPGNTTLQVGDLVGLDILNKNRAVDGRYDKYLSGRYLVTQLRHSFVKGNGQYKHTTIMHCAKDNLTYPLPNNGVTVRDGGYPVDTEILPGNTDPSNSTY
jgi:hypothetical protein